MADSRGCASLGIVEVLTGAMAERAHQLVMAYGRNAAAFQILNPGIAYWFSARRDAVVGYVQRRGWLLVAAEPVCRTDALPEAVEAFEAFAHSRRCHVCYVCAAEPMRELLAGSPNHAAVAIGAQPVW